MQKSDIITGNQFKVICDDYFDEEKTHLDISKKPKTIFLKTDWIETFKQQYLPQIDYSFKLITHNSDGRAPSGYIDLLEDSRLIKWYGMNCEIVHPKLQPIPIGIANAQRSPHHSGCKDELIQIINTDVPKQNLCYCNFDIATNPRRLEIFNIIQSKGFVNTDPRNLNHIQYLTRLKSCKYVISPPGNSIDCYRIWESIYLDVIPIVEKDLALQYFLDLPILFVNNFSEVTPDLLEKNYESIKARPKDKAMMSHYANLIKQELSYVIL